MIMGTYISSSANRFSCCRGNRLWCAGRRCGGESLSRRSAEGPSSASGRKTAGQDGHANVFRRRKNIEAEDFFEVRTYLTSWNGTGQPCYGPLVQSAMGAAPEIAQGLTLASAPNGLQLETTAPHGLSLGSAVSSANEIRFIRSGPRRPRSL